MKLCVPITENKGLDSAVYGHFGSAPYFMLIDTATKAYTLISNTNKEHQHGMCQPLRALGAAKPDAVAVGGIGKGALAGLANAGIKVYLSNNKTVKDLLADLAANKLSEADIAMTCGGHEGGCGCH